MSEYCCCCESHGDQDQDKKESWTVFYSSLCVMGGEDGGN